MQVFPYLHFNGRAEEALHYYAGALGAKIRRVIRYNETPIEVPPGTENGLIHGELEIGDHYFLMMSDSPYGEVHRADNFAVSLNFVDDERGAIHAFQALADGGEVLIQMSRTYWGAFYGMILDRFGIRWMINLQMSQQQQQQAQQQQQQQGNRRS